MNIKETIAIINQMQADGVIGKYAIGGAVGATFYLEPADRLLNCHLFGLASSMGWSE